MITCFIGLGSNLEQPGEQLARAVSALGVLTSASLVCVSSLYSSKPLGPQNQPDYVNAVAKLETSLPAPALLAQLQAIEAAQKRVRKTHWGPRTLDLDLLLYGDEIIKQQQLIVPHPEMLKRNFVLFPLYEIAPTLIVPGAGKLEALLTKLDRAGLEKLQSGD